MFYEPSCTSSPVEPSPNAAYGRCGGACPGQPPLSLQLSFCYDTETHANTMNTIPSHDKQFNSRSSLHADTRNVACFRHSQNFDCSTVNRIGMDVFEVQTETCCTVLLHHERQRRKSGQHSKNSTPNQPLPNPSS